MAVPLLLTRRLTTPIGRPRRLPDHHYDPALCANVVADGTLLVHAADPNLVADYTSTQEPSGLKTDD
ncbi:hypothetical protein [Embleya hyalina]|uniref:Uncharacterized protein n=1 Tax=Embleya hyalina TaxID=516124 RepID=A0A401YEU2_9ACTN|nr:hypothetical protein [Embleya hyalina]GCD93105.1 hypothetical protein EHYA_00748 [Embleya hyalina]